MKSRRAPLIKKWICGIMLLSLLLLSVTGCGQQEVAEDSTASRVYYLDKDEVRLVYEEYTPTAEGNSEIIREFLQKLMEAEDLSGEKAPLQMGFELQEYRIEEDQLVLTVSPSYKEMSPTREVLVRAALVRTLVQVPGISGVSIMVGNEALLDAAGNPVGVMGADTFVDNEGMEINAYEQTTLLLYYANAEGTGLVPVRQTVVYNTNTSTERLVLEQLIDGSEGMGVYPAIPPDTKINSVTVSDGVCYVNFSQEFLKAAGNVTPEVTIYSIVNSLAELPSVYQVQFMVAGESDVMYREVLSLASAFSRNLDLVTE